MRPRSLLASFLIAVTNFLPITLEAAASNNNRNPMLLNLLNEGRKEPALKIRVNAAREVAKVQIEKNIKKAIAEAVKNNGVFDSSGFFKDVDPSDIISISLEMNGLEAFVKPTELKNGAINKLGLFIDENVKDILEQVNAGRDHKQGEDVKNLLGIGSEIKAAWDTALKADLLNNKEAAPVPPVEHKPAEDMPQP